jgi:glycosyltransferase involved in cell wall biosynthesis
VKPLVSILIPAYNAERWIAATIHSALQQTWDRKEVIVVDDGSRDGTLQVARRLESNAVKVVTQDNGGACAARNKALEFAQGDYIQWLDADDLLAPDKISQQLLRTEAEPDSLVLLTSAWGRFYFRPERAAFRPDALWSDLPPLEWLITKFEQGVWMNPGAWLVSRKLTELAGPWDGRLAFSGDDDGEYMCRLVAKSVSVKFAPLAKSYYRVGNAGLSWRKSDKALDSFFLATSLCLQHLRSLEDSSRTRAACLKLLQARLSYFYPLRPTLVAAVDQLASDLGGSLNAPTMTWRFRLVKDLMGWERAMRLKNWVWASGVRCRKNWDGALDRLAGLRDTTAAGRQ